MTKVVLLDMSKSFKCAVMSTFRFWSIIKKTSTTLRELLLVLGFIIVSLTFPVLFLPPAFGGFMSFVYIASNLPFHNDFSRLLAFVGGVVGWFVTGSIWGVIVERLSDWVNTMFNKWEDWEDSIT